MLSSVPMERVSFIAPNIIIGGVDIDYPLSFQGKSTIVCAITLGLGGQVKSLARQKHLSDFVNNTNPDEDALIEIELSNTSGENHTIQSNITKSRGRNGFIR